MNIGDNRKDSYKGIYKSTLFHKIKMFAYDSFLTKGIFLNVTLVNTERKVNNKLIPFFQLQYLLSLILSMLI